MKTVVLDQLTFKRDEEIIFQSLDYAFEEGTFTLLRGISGCGKSTLLKLIAGFTDLSYEGTILVNQETQESCSVLKKASTVGMVFQNPNQQFTMGSLRREITFALENLLLDYSEIQRRLARATELTNTSKLLDRKLVTLSGGEKQRASLAVLLAMDTPILLLDEPFASVDIASRRELIQLLEKLRHLGKTIILCDHDLSDYESHVDEVVTLKKDGLKKEELAILTEKESPMLTKEVSHEKKLITLDKVGLTQGKRELLKISDFSFQEGITTLTGDNGTGKSTLLKAIVQQKKYQGTMYLKNQRMKKKRKLYQQLTLAVQDARQQFVCLTPKEELSFNVLHDKEIEKKQEEVLGKLGLLDKLENSLFHLSEGQKKMIQLIAMLSLERDIFLLDEPFTGLDALACQIFMDWMKEKEKHFVIVSHRLSPLSGNSDHHVRFHNQQLAHVGQQMLEGEILSGYRENQFA